MEYQNGEDRMREYLMTELNVSDEEILSVKESKGGSHYIVNINGKYGVYSKSGKEILPPQYDRITYNFRFNFVKVKLGKKFGCLSDVDIFTGCEYDKIITVNTNEPILFLKDGRKFMLTEDNKPTNNPKKAHYGYFHQTRVVGGMWSHSGMVGCRTVKKYW